MIKTKRFRRGVSGRHSAWIKGLGRPLRLSLLMLLLAGPASAADFATEWPALTAKIEEAVANDRIDDLRALRVSCLKLLTTPLEKPQQVLVRYGVAYIGWRLAFQPPVPDKEVDDLLKDALTHLEAALKVDDKFAEGHLLQSAVYSAQIAKAPMKGMTLGGRAGDALDRAAALAPENPRVVLQQGMSAFHTPAMFGGSKSRAEQLLRRSTELFAKEPATAAWPNWGRFDAHAWLGQLLAEKGDKIGARAEYDQALKVAPASGWVRYVLIPALGR